MENCSVRVGSLICVITILIAMIGSAKAEEKWDPMSNLNRSPVWQWRNAYECLLNGAEWGSDVCKGKGVLKLDGVISVKGSEEVKKFCKECAQHTMGVLKCVNYAKRDFWFANKATVHYINNTLTTHCDPAFKSSGFTTADYTSNAITKLPTISIIIITLAFTIGTFFFFMI